MTTTYPPKKRREVICVVTDDESDLSEEKVEGVHESVPILRMPRLVRSAIKGSKPIVAFFSYTSRVPAAANTDIVARFPLQPNLDGSWVSWQFTFDEIKVLSAEIFWQIERTAAPTVDPVQSPTGVMVYDPTDASLASVQAGLQYEHFQLVLSTSSTATFSPGATAMTNPQWSGFYHFAAKVPQGEVLSNVSTITATGGWRPTQDASNYDWGSFNSYVTKAGTTSVIQILAYVRLKCLLRTRR